MKIVDERFVRSKTKIIDPDTIKGVLCRYHEFCELKKLEPITSNWSLFYRDVGWLDFKKFAGTKFTVQTEDGEKEVEFVQPYYWRGLNEPEVGMFGPEYASVKSVNRFEKFSPFSQERKYPVDSDIEIWVEVKGGTKEHPKSELVSYNQLAELNTSGRKSHWTDPGQYKGSIPSDTFFGDGNMDCNWFADPLYRVTPKGQPTVEDLLPVGTIVESSYSKEYIVLGVSKNEHIPIERPDGYTFDYYSISMADKETNKKGYGESELVAIDGRILKLYMTNDDEMIIKGHIDELPELIEESFEEEDENEELYCEPCEINIDIDSAPQKDDEKKLIIKGCQQPSLF